MYSNINTEHGLWVIEQWLALHAHELPKEYPSGKDFPSSKVVKGLRLVLENNVFQFDDTFWRQKTGTPMGTSVACVYATIYYSFHEELKILPPQHGLGIFFYRRFIDDIFAIILLADDGKYERLVQALNSFGEDPGKRLKWEASKPSMEVNFLDLTIMVGARGNISTRTFQKAINLYMYIPPHSAHPVGVLKGVIYGNIRRFWLQNSSLHNFKHVVSAFFKRLVDRGHSPQLLRELFHEASQGLEIKLLTNNPEPGTNTAPRPFILHQRYHPEQIPRKAIQQAYRATIGTLANRNDVAGAPEIAAKRLIVAYSRPTNLRN